MADFGPIKTRIEVLILSLLGVALVGFVDNWTGYEVSVSVFYLFPVLAAAWYVGLLPSIAVSLFSAFTWYWVEVHSGHAYSHPAIPIWNALVRLGFFLTNCFFASEFHIHLDQVRRLARQDTLTGLMNGRAFLEEAERFFALLRRKAQPVTLIYLDLDNFKGVNDTWGHSEGDKVLCVVADALKRGKRGYDLAARLGGDEFCIMLPETDRTAAKAYVDKLVQRLEAEMAARCWPVTFSVGVVTFQSLPETVDKALGVVDALMYRVKQTGKHGVLQELWTSAQNGTTA
jgi:diguanylate cyclase (GGDEF)-like protein